MENSRLAPIILFAFNRPQVFQRLIESLKDNPEFKDSEIFIFIDGPRANKPGEAEKVEEVRKIALSGLADKEKSPSHDHIHLLSSDKNRGLAPSIIKGVSSVICQFGKAIIFEDDLYLAPNCLHFMNEGLDKYENDKSVFSICGYTNKVKVPKDYSFDTYMASRSSSWGWATWKDRWEKVDWELKDWNSVRRNSAAFNKWGGSDCFHMLNKWHNGVISSWAIRFCYAEFVSHAWSVFPVKSLIKNDGFDGTGTNMKRYSRFKFEFDERNMAKFRWCPSDLFCTTIQKEALSYSSYVIRIWSKLMYIIKG